MTNPFDRFIFGDDQPKVTRPTRVCRARINAPREMTDYMSAPGDAAQIRREVEYLIVIVLAEVSSLYLECRSLDYQALAQRLVVVRGFSNFYAHFHRNDPQSMNAYSALADAIAEEIAEVIGPILTIECTGSPRIRLDVSNFTKHAISVEMAIY